MKATFVLPNDTRVELDGDASDVQELLAHFSRAPAATVRAPRRAQATARRDVHDTTGDSNDQINEIDVVNRIKSDDALTWLHDIIDSRDVTDRVLLPLYVAGQMEPRTTGLTSGFISRVYAELGVRISVPNVSTELSRKAKRYVLADAVRRKGAPVRYKISRAGVSYLEQRRRV
jgi:hypothetical protein